MKNSAALYMRLSKEDGKNEKGSIGSQRALLRDYAGKNGFSVFDEYIDEGYSGTNFERPEFRRMISDIEKGFVDTVLIKDLSRLGRDYISAGEYTEIYFPSKGVRCVSVTEAYDSMDGDDMLPFRNILNEMYARDISRKIRAALAARMNKGDFIGPFAPFGYKRSPDEKHKLVPDDSAAGAVKMIFSERAKGKSLSEIAEMLDEKGVPTPLEHRNKMPKAKKWSTAAILKIIRNEVYIGNMVQGKTKKLSFKSKKSLSVPEAGLKKVKSTHEALIDEETFIKANSIGR